MCNLYAVTTNQEAIRRLFTVSIDRCGNLPSLPAVYPDQMAPVILAEPTGKRVLAMMRWGFPPPPNAGTRPVTNVRNTASPFWRPWLRRESRCLVPASSFCEYTDSTPKVAHWFARDEDRSPFAFAGIWRTWQGRRKGEDGEHHLFAFLTTAANETVGPIHAKAMPVILTADTWDRWLDADVDGALALQKPIEAARLMVVAHGLRSDPGLP